ncbi:hypothetical protein AQUCO_02800003v1 [Aquilegia coerulea]|uniref:Uncharacterized protein n=1 Tax=Aquilegia coerulea TaxID=218851 RepID=A0A2G5D3I3_AQUCA|nr:hypothetical protein AQUCO_02800003v1 [Aquilegia coerulea]
MFLKLLGDFVGVIFYVGIGGIGKDNQDRLSVATLEMNQQIQIIWMIPNPILHLSFNHFRRTTSLHFLDAESS